MCKPKAGIATTELAICLPVILAITFAVIETTTAIHLKETATLAAYEGARIGVRKQGTNDDARDKVIDFLDSRGVNYDADVVEISDPGFDSADELEHVSITVNIPCQGNTIVSVLFANEQMSATVTMRKEYANQE